MRQMMRTWMTSVASPFRAMQHRAEARCHGLCAAVSMMLAWMPVVIVMAAPPPQTRPAGDPFAVGAEIEALWHDRWTDTVVLSRSGDNAEVMFGGASKETVGPAKLRTRGVTADAAAKLTSQTGLFAEGAKVEIKWGAGWMDGVIVSRDAINVKVKTSDGFTHSVAANDVRTRAVAAPPPAPPVAPPMPPATVDGVATAPANSTKSGVPVANALVPGALIEFPFGTGGWFDGVVKGRDGSQIKIVDTHGFEKSLAPAELRTRGVPLAQLSPEKQAECLKPGAKVEATNGSWWEDGIVEKRDARRVMVRNGAFTTWHDFADVRALGVKPGAVAGSTTGPAVAAMNPFAPDRSEARRIELTSAPAGPWTTKPDPSTQPVRPAPPRPAAEAGKPVLIPLPPMASIAGAQNAMFQHVADLIVPSGSATGMVVHTQDAVADRPFIAQIERIDLISESISGPIRIPPGLMPIDTSADGRRVLLTAHNARSQSVIEVWSIESKLGQPVPAKIKEIEPFAGIEGSNGNVAAATFIDTDHVLFAGGNNDLVMIDVPRMKVVWATKTLAGMPRIALSPGHKQLAVPAQHGVFLLDSMTGDTLGMLPGALLVAADMRFSPDGAKLICISAGSCNAWEIGTGKLWRSFPLSGSASRPQWVGDNYVMVDGTRLLDLEHRAVIWMYEYSGLQGRHPVSAAGAGKFWYLTADMPKPGAKAIRRQLAGLVLPPPSVTATVAAIKPEELYSWYPGMTVSLSVSVSLDTDKVAAALKSALEQRGFKVADGAPVRVEATTSPGESKSITYQMHSFGPGAHGLQSQTVTITPTISRVQILDSTGKSVWQSTANSGGFAPPMISLKQGQTAQDVVDEYSKPSLSFFTTREFPEYIAKQREKEGFGQSVLTGNGIEMVKAP